MSILVTPNALSRQGIRCKVCDQGHLILRRRYRMSGPAVAIGYILLIPSILGIILCAVLYVGAIGIVGAAASQSAPVKVTPRQDSFEIGFRQTCLQTGISTAQPSAALRDRAAGLLMGYCECALDQVQQGMSTDWAATVCKTRLENGQIQVPSRAVRSLYNRRSIDNPAPARAAIWPVGFGLLTGSILLLVVVGLFVSGLLGWLLVMRKRVLQCDVCSAVVNAS